MMSFVAGLEDRDVPDPWYGDQRAYVDAFDLIERGVLGLLEQVRPRLG
jgi:protein-tyrosine phosphatase